MSVETVIEWADCKINEQTNNNIFYDLLTARTANKIVELLSERVTWKYNNTEIRSLLLSYYNSYLNENLDSWLNIEKELLEYFHMLEYDNSNESTQDFLYYLDDDWHLRKDGFGGLLSMPAYLTENLAEFKDYDNLKELLKRQGLSGYEV
jgi:hypothetical protein